MSSLSKIRQETADRMADDKPANRELPCSVCGTMTPAATLSDFGARCYPCYAAYCRASPGYPAPVPASAIPANAGKRAWAWKLKARHERGDRLTPAQIATYQDALRPELRSERFEEEIL